MDQMNQQWKRCIQCLGCDGIVSLGLYVYELLVISLFSYCLYCRFFVLYCSFFHIPQFGNKKSENIAATILCVTCFHLEKFRWLVIYSLHITCSYCVIQTDFALYDLMDSFCWLRLRLLWLIKKVVPKP